MHSRQQMPHAHVQEAYVYGKRALRRQKYGKRALRRQKASCLRKSPTCMAKEAYVYGKRGLRVWQKSPTCMAKEAYVYGKRALRRQKASGLGVHSVNRGLIRL